MRMILPAHSDGITLSLAELVHYQQQSVRWVPPAKSIWSHLSGQHVSRMKGRGMDFTEVRPYQQGDDIRTIDWRITARTGKPHTKLFTEEREYPVMLAIDLSAGMQFGTQLLYKSVQAAHMASLLCWLAIENRDRIGAVVIGGDSVRDCPPTGHHQGPLRIFNVMQQVQKQTQQQLAENPDALLREGKEVFSKAIGQLHQLCPKGSDIVIISDFYHLSPQVEKRLKQLAQHNRLRLVNIYDPLELGETAFRGRSWLSDFKQTVQVSFGQASTRDALSSHYRQHQDTLKQLATKVRAPIYSLSAGQELLDQLGGRRG
uniref:DUF58 domain-containing protein n=1 Tax=Thaumasiovibrio occultus TaxID=1891184 RepID=UPI000B35065C|nr:DUF58 domain-containing protein [Thaumasiovibrio occultus]